MQYLYLSIAIAAEVIATSFLKLSEAFSKPVPSLVTVIGYAVAFYFLSLTLKTMSTGIVYAIWSGVGITLIAIIAWLFQGQKLDVQEILGISLIVAGVVVLSAFSRQAAH